MIVIYPLIFGLLLSILALILYFSPLTRTQRKEGDFKSSELTILVIAISLAISTYFTVDLFIQALNYIQNPPPYWIEDSPTEIAELFFIGTFIPLLATSIILLLAHFSQKRISGN